jgi:hypothetical protein
MIMNMNVLESLHIPVDFVLAWQKTEKFSGPMAVPTFVLDEWVWYQCCFCGIDSEAIWDGFPISKGHTLVVPNSRFPSFHDLDSKTQVAVWGLGGVA